MTKLTMLLKIQALKSTSMGQKLIFWLKKLYKSKLKLSKMFSKMKVRKITVNWKRILKANLRKWQKFIQRQQNCLKNQAINYEQLNAIFLEVGLNKVQTYFYSLDSLLMQQRHLKNVKNGWKLDRRIFKRQIKRTKQFRVLGKQNCMILQFRLFLSYKIRWIYWKEKRTLSKFYL